MAAFIDHALPADLQQRDAGGRIEIRLAAAHQPLLARLLDQRIQPVVVA